MEGYVVVFDGGLEEARDGGKAEARVNVVDFVGVPVGGVH